MKKLSRICVLYNLPGTSTTTDIEEADDDTKSSAIGVYDTLKKCGFDMTILGIGVGEIDQIKEINTDLIFNLIEWTGVDMDLGVRAIKVMEEKKMAFTGSGSIGYELSSNKVLMKKKFDELGILTPKWEIMDKPQTSGFKTLLDFPLIVKPALEHCGIGLTQASVVKNESELSNEVIKLIGKFNQPILVEEYIEGREIQVTVFEKDGRPWVLPAAEVSFVNKPGVAKILTYEGKWDTKSADYQISSIGMADVSDDLRSKTNDVCRKCYEKMDGRDYPRVDTRVKDNQVYVLEINNNPGIGFDTESGIGLSARAVGFNYESMLTHIAQNAFARYAS